MARRPSTWTAMLMVWLCALSVMAAPTEADIATARVLANEGFDAWDAGDYAKAEDRFQRASELYAAPTVLLGLARARVKLGKYVEAHDNYQQVIHSKLSPNANETFRDAQRSAATEVKDLEAKLAWLTVTAGSPPDNLTITLDGAPLAAAAVGTRRPINPGPHRLRATADGHEPFESAFTVSEGEAHTVDIALTSTSDSGDPWLIAGFVALGVGAAGLVVGAVTGGIAMSQESELEEHCIANRCEADHYDTLDSYRLTSTVSTVAFIAGGVLAAGGLTLVLVRATGGDSPSAALSLGPGTLSFGATW